MSKNKTAKKHSILIVVLFVLVGALLCMSAFNLFKVSTQFTTKTLTTIDYEVGDIDEDGENLASDESIRTKDYYSTDGLVITVKDSSKITYKLFIYDEDQEYLTTTSDATALPSGAAYFRLVVYPTENVELSYLDIGTYSSHIVVTFNK